MEIKRSSRGISTDVTVRLYAMINTEEKLFRRHIVYSTSKQTLKG